MKRLKKALISLIAVCMLVSGFSFSAYASSGQLRFSDPSTTVGAEVEVTATFTGTTAVRTAEATLTYDTSMLRFEEGKQVTGSDGTLKLSGAGDGTSTQLNFSMTFQALKEGTTVIEISSVSGTDVDGDDITVTKGQSTVKIGAGDPSLIKDDTAADKGISVEVDGASYVISDGFSDTIVPEGFSRSQMQFEGQDCTVVTQEASGAIAMYLVPADGGDGDFYLYSTDDGSFSPFEEVELSPNRYLILLQDDGSVNVPGGYKETTLTLNGKNFPAWQNTNNTEYYLVYGLNSDGNKVLYQYDTTDGTYQRYVRPMSISTDESGNADGIMGKVLQFISDNLRWVMVAACILFVIIVIILIVTIIKLHHRNIELDDLYDEYGIDLEEEPEEEPVEEKKLSRKEKKALKKAEKQARKEQKEELEPMPEEETFEEYAGDYDDDDDFDDYDDDDFGSYTGSASRHMVYEDDDDEEDPDELLNARVREPAERPRTKPKKLSHAEDDDTFKMDIIDLD